VRMLLAQLALEILNLSEQLLFGILVNMRLH
jgi:hypothetical protein